MACAVLTVVGVIGTTKPRGPQSTGDWLVRFWQGGDRNRGRQRVHQFMLLTAISVGVGAWLFTGLPVVGVLAMIAVPGAPWLFRVGADERRVIELIEAVGEWTRRLKDISATGAGLQQAIVASANTAPIEIGRDVRDLAARLQAGVDMREALLAFADAINDPVCDQVIAALLLHLSDRGDRLGDVLGAIATATSAEVATRREVDAKRTQSRFAVKFLTFITVGVIGFGVARPQYMEPYHSPFGQLVMATMGTAFIVILLWVRRMSQPVKAPRFLNSAAAYRSLL
jgi:Flp pilus assembly protein TadB